MDRRQKALNGITVSSGVGLELGPLASPFVRRTDGKILYADHATTNELRQKYAGHGWDTDTIVDVDIVLSDRPLQELLGDLRVDYVIASHVIEHVPDPISWLTELGNVLRPGGVISLVIPDKRYCFDAKRPLSTTGELLDAWISKRRSPSVRQVFDFWAFYCQVDTAAVWGKTTDVETLPRSGTLRNAFERASAVIGSTKYADVHCWVFTPASFMSCLAELAELSLFPFKVKNAFDTAPNELEFFVTLEPMSAGDDPHVVSARFRRWAEAFAKPAPPVLPMTTPNPFMSVARPIFRALRRVAPQLATSIRDIVISQSSK